MDTHLQFQPQPDYLHSHVQPLATSAASVESTCQGRKVSQYQGEVKSLKEEEQGLGARAWSSIKSIPRTISIFCRAIGKVSLVAYYFVKHQLFGYEFTSEHLQNYLQRLGSAYPKMLQTVVANPELLKELGKLLNTTKSERKKFDGVIRDVLDNNPEIPASVPRSILDKAGCQDHSVQRHIASGTIGSCFEVKKGDESLVAKVVPDWKADDLAAGLQSIRMLLFFMPKELRTTIREMTDPFVLECDLKEEKKNQLVFKETLEKTQQTERLDTYWVPQATTLTFKVPKINEAVGADNLLMMEYLQDGHTLNALTDPENEQLRSEVYQRCFGKRLVNDALFRHILEQVHSQIKAKWRELALVHGVVHGDCHPGNIMLSCKPDGHLDVWFIDFGNCISLTEAQRTQYPEIVRLLSNLADPFAQEAMDQARFDRLVDTLWDDVAISHRANTPDNKAQFKNLLRDEFTKLRDLDSAIDRVAERRSLTPLQKAELRANCQDPLFQEEAKVLLLSLISANLGSVCKLRGVQLPSSFTRYISAHFRAGVILN
ncbi:AarF/UbiB family protein [Endozoicomonas sp. SESOKO1]|uniref:AarF/UbiB family protein n=1 Tax=Endozoicomonas sp. SESOKO1 TaxID=2828742 RepID=UPI00214757F8|nr:AarF/UbiB family protein [Endozoicomonas sp. SESOKO1]